MGNKTGHKSVVAAGSIRRINATRIADTAASMQKFAEATRAVSASFNQIGRALEKGKADAKERNRH